MGISHNLPGLSTIPSLLSCDGPNMRVLLQKYFASMDLHNPFMATDRICYCYGCEPYGYDCPESQRLATYFDQPDAMRYGS